MKKSNIVLLTAFLLVLAAITVAAVHFRGILMTELEWLKRGDGNIRKELRDVKPFNSLYVAGNITVYFTQNRAEEVVIEADSNLIEHIKTDVENGILNISHNRDIRVRNLKVHVSREYLDEVSLSGGSRFQTEKPVIQGDINLTANGGSRFEVNGEFEVLNMEINAGSIARLKGQCEDLFVTAKAGSNLIAKDLAAQDVKLHATAGSILEVRAVKTLSVNASSGSNIRYYGEPELKEIHTSSGASLRHR